MLSLSVKRGLLTFALAPRAWPKTMLLLRTSLCGLCVATNSVTSAACSSRPCTPGSSTRWVDRIASCASSEEQETHFCVLALERLCRKDRVSSHLRCLQTARDAQQPGHSVSHTAVLACLPAAASRSWSCPSTLLAAALPACWWRRLQAGLASGSTGSWPWYRG